MKGDRKCVINGRVTLDIVTSCIERQCTDALVGEVQNGQVDRNLLNDCGE